MPSAFAAVGDAPVAKTSRYEVIARDTPAHLLGSAIVDRLIEEIVAQAPGVLGGADPEATHDMRVAIRRLRNALETFGGNEAKARFRRFVKTTRRLGRRLGAVRDGDVHLDLLRRALANAAPEDAAGIEFAIDAIAARRVADLAHVGPAIEGFLSLRPAGPQTP